MSKAAGLKIPKKGARLPHAQMEEVSGRHIGSYTRAVEVKQVDGKIYFLPLILKDGKWERQM
jgi:hypothetical protein